MSSFNPRHRTTLAGKITIALYRITQAIDHIFRERSKVRSLSPAQIQSLLFLKYARPGVRTIGGLASRLGTTYATSSGVADALERKGWIKRTASPSDQRVVILKLTPKGEGEAGMLEDVLDDLEATVNALPEAEQTALLHATQSIVRQLQSAGYVQVYEMCWNCQFFQRYAHPDDPRGPHHCAFMNAPLPEPDTHLECPDFVPADNFKGGDATPLPLTFYGATDCDGTKYTRGRLHELGVSFREVNIDHDHEAERFVNFISHGVRRTPTLVFGEGNFKIILTEPTDQELSQVLIRAGYSIHNTTQSKEAQT